MKTIGYIDRCNGNKTLNIFKADNNQKHFDTLFNQKKYSRVFEALQDLKRVGNIKVYLINGNKKRLLFEKGI